MSEPKSEDKWQKAAREERESIPGLLKERTVVEVNVDLCRIDIVFDDGSSLDIGCYVEQRRGGSDVAELAFELSAAGTHHTMTK